MATLVVFGVLLVGCGSSSGSTTTTAAAAATTTRPTGPTRPLSASGIAHWHQVTSTDQNTLHAGEGVASLTSGGADTIIYRGIQSIPATLSAEGWGHIGDPDAAAGDIIDAYQGPASGHSKMFLVTTPTGATYQYVHTLVADELYNNSFDAISPNHQWMVAGEWGTMDHLQIYPAPLLNRRTAPTGGPLTLAGLINLDHQVNDVQGCDFITATTLVCASDDDSRTLFANQKPLVEVQLAHALRGSSVSGHVTDLGSIPQQSACTGTFEAEGVDYDTSTRILRVEIIQPGSCILHTTVYEYSPTRS
jgi:hypothetical protein